MGIGFTNIIIISCIAGFLFYMTDILNKLVHDVKYIRKAVDSR
jgi:hypothetical protein